MLRFADPGGRVYGATGTSNANAIAYWSNGAAANSISCLAVGGRTTGTCLRFGTANGGTYLNKTLDSRATWGVALAFRCSTFINNWVISTLNDNATNHCDIRMDAVGFISVTRAGTVLGTSSIPIQLNVWNHLEWKITIDGSAGATELRINGVTRIGPLTSINTKVGAGGSTANIIYIGSPGNLSGNNADFDDIIFWDTQTTDPAGNTAISDFIGDCGVTCLRPSGAGNSTQWTPDTGSNYARVQESTVDTTSYVESSTISNKDNYALDDLAAGISTVKGIITCHYAEKTDVGSRQMGSLIRTNSTDYTHATGIDLGNSYLYYFRNWDRNPNSTSAWTTSDINALQAGQIVNT